MNILSQLNSGTMYLICGCIILFVALLCVVFMIRAYRAGKAMGMDTTKMKRAITASATFTLISEGHPMYLLPGRYQLSGAPKRPDVTSGYTWGLVVKNVTTGEDCGWDLGEGAEFTLAETTPVRAYIYISKSRNPDGYIWVPKLVGREN